MREIHARIHHGDQLARRRARRPTPGARPRPAPRRDPTAGRSRRCLGGGARAVDVVRLGVERDGLRLEAAPRQSRLSRRKSTKLASSAARDASSTPRSPGRAQRHVSPGGRSCSETANERLPGHEPLGGARRRGESRGTGGNDGRHGDLEARPHASRG